MNKAFIKGDDIWEDLEIELDPRANIPEESRNYMTSPSARKLRKELDALVNHQRPQLRGSIS